MIIGRILLFIFIFISAFLGLSFIKPAFSFAQDKVQVVFFFQENCLECKQTEPYLAQIEDKYKDEISIQRLEVTSSQDNRNAYFAYADKYSLQANKIGVPIIFIGQKSYLGKEAIVKDLEKEIIGGLDKPQSLKISVEDAKKVPTNQGGDITCADQTFCEVSQTSKITLPLVISAAAVDSINPCAIAVLLLLISFLLGIQVSKGRLLSIGLIYIGAVYLAYLLAGLGILKFIQVAPVRTEWILILAALLLLVFAYLSFSDAYTAITGGSKSTLAIPSSAKPFIQKYLSQATIFGALTAGVIVSLVELPCTGAVYFGILSLLSNSVDFNQGLLYLLFYNLIFVAPLVLILFAALIGRDVKILEKFSKENKALVKALMGIIILVLIGALLWPIRDFIKSQFDNLAQVFAGEAISSQALLIGVTASITILYFLLAFLKPAVTKLISVFFCAICYAVSLTWLGLFALLILGFKFDTKLLAVLLGMSVTGIMYQLEDYFKNRGIRRFWLFRIILVNSGIILIYGLLFNSMSVLLVGLSGVLILVLLFFYLASSKRSVIEKIKEALPLKPRSKALKELEDRLENCC